MGVNSLWDILGPTARPVRLEALSRKRLAVDASIWIYQFLKAVRDREGNSLPHSHIIGFFRRICKLLYYGILPIFVFDGGAPALKRQTINQRRERRQGKRESTSQTAQKLLAIQVQRQADRAHLKNKQAPRGDDITEGVYLDDLPNLHPLHQDSGKGTDEQSVQSFRKKDEYHLPEIKSFKVSTNDTRIMPEEEFEELSGDFDHVDGIDINTVDPTSNEFAQLPMATQYMILSHLRLRSRLRMGFTKEQLETLFPNCMDFSKFQIQQVQKRNFYTQRLMDVSGMGDEGNTSRRIAGEKDRKYTLVRNSDGWTLSLGVEESSIDKPISLDENGEIIQESEPEKGSMMEVKDESEEEEEDDDLEWEDVPLEKEETQEEKRVQQAIIESIYDQFKDVGSQGQNMIKQDSFENDLQVAVGNSKKDFFDLQLKEEEMLKERVLEWKSLELDKKANKMEQVPKEKNLPKELSNFSLGSSFLFRSNSKEQNNRISEKHTIMNKDIKGTKIDQYEIQNPEEKKTLNDSSIREEEQEIIEIEEMTKEDNDTVDKQITEGKKDKKLQPLPSWFSVNISAKANPHQNFVSSNEATKNKLKYQEDEEAGLISWNEAKNMIDDDLESVHEDYDEVEEVSRPQGQYIVEKEKDTSNEAGNVKESSIETKTKAENRKPAVLDYDFEEREESELIKQLENEEIDHEHFKSAIKANHNIPLASINTSVTHEQLLQEQLQKAKRDSDEVTETMINDVQELLWRFGIPYITAPMEAEAQCAELLKLNLVDGIITDDSDCFLFGGDRVYKNMFNQKQYVECYVMNEIEAKIGLTQGKLIELALLLGSDYTEGIKGIGPVMAMEILAEFGSLEELKKWFDENTKTTIVHDKSALSGLKKNLLNRVKNGKLFLPDTFPDKVIFDAYKSPEVDHDRSEFKWGVPSLDQIRSFLIYNVNWSQAKVDEVMVPLIRDMNRKRAEGSQSTIGEFFPQEYIQTRKEVGLGKRMKSAANKLNKRRNINK